MRSPDVIEAVRRRLAMVLGLVWERFGPRAATGTGLGSGLRWLRPLVAMSVAVFVIGSGIYIGLASPAAIFNTNGVTIGGGADGGTHPGGPGHSGHGATDGSGSPTAHSTMPNSSGSSPACKQPLSRYKSAAGPSNSPSGQPTSPATSPSQSSSPSSSPSVSPSPSSSPASSGNSAATPAAGLAGANAGNALSGTGTSKSGRSGRPSNTGPARTGALSASAPPSPVAGGPNLPSSNSPKYNPCQTRKRKHHRKTILAIAAGPTGLQLTQTGKGGAVAAKLD